MKFMIRFILLMALPLVALAVPNYINYQGRLLDNNGIPITQNSMAMVVSIWTASVAGTKLYQENQTVDVNDGVYAFQIGNGTGGTPAWDPTNLFNTSSPRFVELTVQGQTLTPRFQLLSAPFTLQSGNSDNLGGNPPAFYGTASMQIALQNQIAGLQGQLIDICNASATSKWSYNQSFCFGGAVPKCKGSDFSGENFVGVHLMNAVCQGAVFKSVDFTGADFEGATDFSGADFSGANVTGVIWGIGVICPNKTVIQKAGDVCIQGGKG